MGPKIKGYRYADDGTHPARFRIGSDADKREAWRIREFLTDDIAERKVHYDTWVEEPRERTLSEEDAQRLRMLHVFSSRRWDLAYLSLLTFWCVLLAGSDWIPDQFTHYLVLPQLAMSFCALVPSVGAVFFRYLQNDWTNITALDESRNWGVFFVLALKSTARGMEAGKPPPTLKSCLLETLDNWKKRLEKLRAFFRKLSPSSAKVGAGDDEERPKRSTAGISDQNNLPPVDKDGKNQWRCIACAEVNKYTVDLDKMRWNLRTEAEVELVIRIHERTGQAYADFVKHQPILKCKKCGTPKRYKPRKCAQHLFDSTGELRKLRTESFEKLTPEELERLAAGGRSKKTREVPLSDKLRRFRLQSGNARNALFDTVDDDESVRTSATHNTNPNLSADSEAAAVVPPTNHYKGEYILPTANPPKPPKPVSTMGAIYRKRRAQWKRLCEPVARIFRPARRRISLEWEYNRRVWIIFRVLFLDEHDEDEDHYLYSDFRLKQILDAKYRVHVPRFSADPFDLYVGQDVECHMQQSLWYPGRITRRHDNGTFDVLYDNGQNVAFIEGKDIRGRPKVRQPFVPGFIAGASVVLALVWPLFTALTLADPERADVAAVLPLFFYAFAILVAMIAEFFVKKMYSGGAAFGVRIWGFFAAPFLWLWVYAAAVLGAVNDRGNADWGGVLFCSVMFSVSACGVTSMLEPALGLYCLAMSAPYTVFQFLLARHMRTWREDGSPKPPLIVVMVPMLLFLMGAYVGHYFLPYVWEARCDDGSSSYYARRLAEMIEEQYNNKPKDKLTMGARIKRISALIANLPKNLSMMGTARPRTPTPLAAPNMGELPEGEEGEDYNEDEEEPEHLVYVEDRERPYGHDPTDADIDSSDAAGEPAGEEKAQAQASA